MNATSSSFQEMFQLVKHETQWDDDKCREFVENYIKNELTIALDKINQIHSHESFFQSLTGPQRQYYSEIRKEFDESELRIGKIKQMFGEKEREYKIQIQNLLSNLGDIKEQISEVIRNKGEITK
jgi:hypothetical protein